MTTPAIEVRTIVFATDFSAHSGHAFHAALALAQHFGARLHLFHALHREAERGGACARLTALADEYAPGGSVVAVAVGAAAAEIVKYAERVKADMIVMGSHGRTGLVHVVRGSVAEAVVRHGPCLVLTLRGSAPVPVAAPAAVPLPEPATAHVPPAPPEGRCLVCGHASEPSICDMCRDRIRADAFYWKRGEEKPGSS
jgi:universal stress protein A